MQKLLLLVVIECLAAIGSMAVPTNSLVYATTPRWFQRGKAILFPEREEEYARDVLQRAWEFRKDFTFFDNVSNVTSEAESLSFVLKEGVGTIGWGNYGGRQAPAERVRLWPQVHIQFDLKQSQAQPLKVRLRFWRDGVRESDPEKRITYEAKNAPAFTKEVSSNNWQTLDFAVYSEMPSDGFDLEFTGAAGTGIELRNLKIWRAVYEGYARKEIVLPAGKIWSARVDIGNGGRLFVNGREIPDQRAFPRRTACNGAALYRQEAVEIADYLVPGTTNCIGLYGKRQGHWPNVLLRGAVIMVDGTRLLLDSDEGWQWSPVAGEGWATVSGDGKEWRQIAARPAGKNESETNAFVQTAWNFTCQAPSGRPVYDGLVHLSVLGENQLFGSTLQPLRLFAEVPRGLKEREPQLIWRISRHKDSALTEITNGTCRVYELRGNSLRWVVDVGRLPMGVYVAEMDLVGKNGELIEIRAPEPVVVVGREEMIETMGTTYEEGMDLELEREIDLTNPKDPRASWMEVDGQNVPSHYANQTWEEKYVRLIEEPLIVKRGGLCYRETRPYYGAQISYQVSFAHPGDFYLMVLEYPDDQKRLMGVSCTSEMYGHGHKQTLYSKCGPTVRTGWKAPLTKKMREMKWIYRPDPDGHAINLINLYKGGTAAGARLRIYHIRGGLPALKAPDANTRWFGVITENSQEGNSFAQTFGIRREPVPEDTQEYYARFLARNDTKPVLELCKNLERYLDTCRHYAMYLRFSGQNAHFMGSYQYDDGNAPFNALDRVHDARIDDDIRSVLVRVLRENGIDVWANVEFTCNGGLLHEANAAVAQPGDTMTNTFYMVDKDGKDVRYYQGRYGFNFNHPTVWQWMLRVADDVAYKFASQPNFKGIVWGAYFGGEWMPTYRADDRKDREMFDLDYSDVTVSRFEADTGIDLQLRPDDPQRFTKRYQLLTSPQLRDIWVQWRAERLLKFFAEANQCVQKYRPDLEVMADMMFYAPHAKEQRQSDFSLRDYLRVYGWDPILFHEAGIPITHFGQAVMYEPAFGGSGYAYGWDIAGAKDFYEVFAGEGHHRPAMVMHHWIEAEEFGALFPVREHWPRPFQSTMQGQAAGDNAGEVFAQLLIGGDPSVYMMGFSHVSLFIGDEQPLRRFAQALRSLPTEKFSPVLETGFDTNLAIRQLRKEGKLYFYVVNPGYWPIKGEVKVERTRLVRNLVTDEVMVEKRKGKGVVVEVDLKPYAVAAFCADGWGAEIEGWNNAPVAEKELEFLDGLIRQAEGLLADARNRVVLDPENLKYMTERTTAARQAFGEGRYAAAWRIVTEGHYWVLREEYLEKAALYSTESETGKLEVGQRALQVRRVKSGPVVDGHLDDAVWGGVEASGNFMDASKKPAIVGTRVRAVHDGEALYLAFECRDRRPEKVQSLGKEEKEIYAQKDDAVVMFIQPVLGTRDYYQMAFNPGGVKFDQEVKGGDRIYEYAPAWEVKTSMTSNAWVAEVKFPAEIFRGGVIASGKQWGFNAHRIFRQNEVPPMSWCYSGTDWHNPRLFGLLIFE